MAKGSSDSDHTENSSCEEFSDDGFEDQGSSSSEEEEEFVSREVELERMRDDGSLAIAKHLHVDDLSSDDEESRNTIGNVPLRWYDEYEHIGYDLGGKKLIRSDQGDHIDNAIAAKDDPNYSRTVYDAYNDRKVVLSDRDLEVIRRIQAGAYAHPEMDANPEYVDYFSSKKMVHSLGNDVEPKSRFLPSKWEKMRVMKIIKGIEEGRIVLDKKVEEKPDSYLLWQDGEDSTKVRKGPAHVPAPKMALPGHAESYNPPEEYLFTEEEKAAWEEMDPSDRDTNFVPQKFDSMRQVAGYANFARERFERCLDLYLCPRVNKRRLNIDPESLVPQLPKPRDLKPFPNTLAILYEGHSDRVRTLAMGPFGQYFASGSDDGTVRLWELDTGKCIRSWKVNGVVYKIEWNPNNEHHVLAVATGYKVYLIATGTGNAEDTAITNALLGEAEETVETTIDDEQQETMVNDEQVELGEDEQVTEKKKKVVPVVWKHFTGNNINGSGIRTILHFKQQVSELTWHHKGDYLSTVAPKGESTAVMIHQISKRKSQCPFSKNIGQVQSVAFHPTKPFFFHATQRHVRIYNLVKQTMLKKLCSGVKWISSMSIHPSGDHLIIGSYDRRVCWFDLDLSSSPYKTLKYHEKAIRDVQYHPRYPLMASASDDGTIQIFHSMVYSDLLKNPLIVPLKILRGHQVSNNGLGVLSIAFHPTQPWIVTAGADSTIRLFQSIHG